MSTTLGPGEVPNTGSNARDFCMLERNLLAHLKLALVLSLLSSSLILRARLVPEPESPKDKDDKADTALASIQFAASLATIFAGIWEYQTGYRDLRDMRAFLNSVNPHFAIMTVVVTAIFATCIVLFTEH